MKFRRRGDLALLETVAVGLAVAALGFFFAPQVWGQTDRASKIQALGEAQRIATALLQYHGDTGSFPTTSPSGEPLDSLHSADRVPQDPRWTNEVTEKLASYLIHPEVEIPGWKAPYLPKSNPDPWGHAYIVNLRGLHKESTEKAWVLSTGPNGRFDTLPSESRVSGDDIGVLIR